MVDDGHARFRPVKLGITGESEVEILEGLSDKDELVTGSYKVLRTIKDGDPVKIENHPGDVLAKKSGSRSP